MLLSQLLPLLRCPVFFACSIQYTELGDDVRYGGFLEQIVKSTRSPLLGCVRPRAAYAKSPIWQECVHVQPTGLQAVPLIRVLVQLSFLVVALIPVVKRVPHNEVHATIAVQARHNDEA